MPYDPKRIGKAIAAARIKRKVSRNKWAIDAGISEGTIRAIENGKTKSPGLNVIYQLADALEAPVWELLGEDVPWRVEYEELSAAMDRIHARGASRGAGLDRALGQYDEPDHD